MTKVTTIPPATMSIREQAEAELRKELAEKAKAKMKDLLRQKDAALKVVAGIDAQIADYEAQIAEGTA
jgi:hypothetical protein